MTETLGTWPQTVDDVLDGLGLPEPAATGERRLALRLGSLATTAKQLADYGRFVTLTTTRERASMILLVGRPRRARGTGGPSRRRHRVSRRLGPDPGSHLG